VNITLKTRGALFQQEYNKSLLFSFDITSRFSLIFQLCKKKCTLSSQKFNEIPANQVSSSQSDAPRLGWLAIDAGLAVQ
jgi:hypothetical protein